MLLQRFYLRVDATLMRVFDTRLYHETGQSFLLREYSEREQTMDKLTAPRETWTDPNLIIDHLPVTRTVMEKLSV